MNDDRRNYKEVLEKLDSLATKKDVEALEYSFRTHIDKVYTPERIWIHEQIATLKAKIIGISSFFGFLGGVVILLIKLIAT